MSNKRKYYKIILIGESGTGKTSLLYRYLPHNWGINATLGVNIERKKIESTELEGDVYVTFWELLGKYKNYTKKFFSSLYAGTKGIMLVFDVTSPQTFNKLTYWQNEIKNNINYEFAGILIGTKIDLPKRKISHSQGQDFADKIGFHYIETSAKQNLNVKEAFEYITKEVIHPRKEKVENIVKEIKRIELLFKEKGLNLSDYQTLEEQLEKLHEKLKNL